MSNCECLTVPSCAVAFPPLLFTGTSVRLLWFRFHLFCPHVSYGVGLYCDVSCSKRVGAMRRWHGTATAAKPAQTGGSVAKNPAPPKPTLSKVSAKATYPLRRPVSTRSRAARKVQWADSSASSGSGGAAAARPQARPAPLRRRTRAAPEQPPSPGRLAVAALGAAAGTVRKARRLMSTGREQVLHGLDPTDVLVAAMPATPSKAAAGAATPTAERTRQSPPSGAARSSTGRGFEHLQHPRQTYPHDFRSAPSDGMRSRTTRPAGDPHAEQYRPRGSASASAPLPTSDDGHMDRWAASRPGPASAYLHEPSLPPTSTMTLSASPPAGSNAGTASATAADAGGTDAKGTGGLVGESLELFYYSRGWTTVDIVAFRPELDEHRVRRRTDGREHWADLRYCRVRFSGEDEIE